MTRRSFCADAERASSSLMTTRVLYFVNPWSSSTGLVGEQEGEEVVDGDAVPGDVHLLGPHAGPDVPEELQVDHRARCVGARSRSIIVSAGPMRPRPRPGSARPTAPRPGRPRLLLLRARRDHRLGYLPDELVADHLRVDCRNLRELCLVSGIIGAEHPWVLLDDLLGKPANSVHVLREPPRGWR